MSLTVEATTSNHVASGHMYAISTAICLIVVLSLSILCSNSLRYLVIGDRIPRLENRPKLCLKQVKPSQSSGNLQKVFTSFLVKIDRLTCLIFIIPEAATEIVTKRRVSIF